MILCNSKRHAALRHLIFFLLITSLPLFAAKKNKNQPPAGVDSTTKIEADSLSQLLLGEKESAEDAQIQFERGQEDFKVGEAFLAEADSLRKYGIDTTLKKPGGLLGILKNAYYGDTLMTSKELETRKRAEASFKQAKKEFEKALKFMPGMKEVRVWLAATYDRLKEWDKSLPLYREILNERQGEDRLWFNYGYAALGAKQYDKAVTAFQQAIDVSTLVNDGDSSKVPNRYRIFAAEAYTRTYQDTQALKTFRIAQQFADEKESEEIQKTIDWILWDNGGIATAEYRDAAFSAENESKWREAQLAYQGGIASARTEKAKDELTWRLSLLEFREASKTEALARIQPLMNKPDCPVEYKESYGKMLFAYAQDLQKSNDQRGAINYYLQSTKFPWSSQGAGYLEIARIAANDLDKAIEQASKALEYPLTKEQQQLAYEILRDSYRSKGNWDKMKYYGTMLEATR